MACKIIYKGISYDESDFKSQIERYVAINNLFNESESLANAVYEAAGIRNPNITVLSNGNLKIIAFRTEKVGLTSKGEYQRGKGLYLSLDKPYPGEDVYTIEIEISPKNLLDRKLGFGEISEDYFIDEKNKRVDKQLDTLHEFKQSLGIKAEIGSIDGALMNELVLFDKKLIDKALASKQVYDPQQKATAQQLYSQYLDTIGVTDIGYHHSESDLESFTTFSEGYFPKELKKKGTHYKEADDIVFFVRKPLSEEFMSKRKFTGTWGLKIPNTLQFNAGEKVGEGVHPGIDKGIKNAVDGNYDAVDFGIVRDNKTWSEVVAITNPKSAVKLGSKQDIQGFKEFVQGKQFQKLTAEEKAKTIEQVTREHRSITALKDLSAKLAYRIGGKVEFENRTDADWKGYNQGNTSVLNEAYMTPDTPFHEIAFHPIIRALKSISSQKESITLQQMIDNQEIEKNCN